MQAQQKFIKQFLAQPDTNFIVPVYQRNYDWKRKQCDQLLKDLLAIKENQQYFIGSIVHKNDNVITGQNKLIIIDGQQRITTLNLLLFTLAEIFKENNDSKMSEEIWDYYLQNKYENSSEKLKLKPIITDNQTYVRLVNGNRATIPNGNRILDNYLFFKERIGGYDDAKKIYANFNRLTIVEIALQQDDDPQKIFQSLNSTGLELSQADLIRNFLLMNLEYSYQEKIFQNYWSIIERNCQKESINESWLSFFFRDFLTNQFNYIPSYSGVFETFKTKYSNIHNDLTNFEEMMNIMKEYSLFYNYLINPDKVESKKLSKELKYISKLEVSVAYPYLLGVFKDFKEGIINEDSLIEILRLVQSLVFRRFICGVPTNALNKIFMSLYNNSKKLREKYPNINYVQSVQLVLLRYTSYQRFPKDDEVIENLKSKDIYSTQSKNKLYLLEKLENESNSFMDNPVDLFERSDISIEHIFPQNPSDVWKNSITQEEYKELEARINTIGNLTIVINNGSLGNRAFTEKRDLNQEDSKGYKYSKFNLNDYLSNIEKWDIQSLNERTNRLCNKFVDIWDYPEVEGLIQVEADIETDLFEIEDPTGKTFSYFVFNGEKVENDSYKAMYIYVLKYLYNEHYEYFYSPEAREIFEVYKNESDYKYLSQIADQCYVYAALSSADILKRLKRLSEMLEESFELKIAFNTDTE